MSHPALVIDSAAPLVKTRSAGEVLDQFARWMGLDPSKLPDPDFLPPWTDEEASEFKRIIDEACGQIENPPQP